MWVCCEDGVRVLWNVYSLLLKGSVPDQLSRLPIEVLTKPGVREMEPVFKVGFTKFRIRLCPFPVFFTAENAERVIW